VVEFALRHAERGWRPLCEQQLHGGRSYLGLTNPQQGFVPSSFAAMANHIPRFEWIFNWLLILLGLCALLIMIVVFWAFWAG
jgi:hypothetical protein